MYRLYDYYEDYGEVMRSENLAEVRKEKKIWIDETDGDCDLEIQKLVGNYWEAL